MLLLLLLDLHVLNIIDSTFLLHSLNRKETVCFMVTWLNLRRSTFYFLQSGWFVNPLFGYFVCSFNLILKRERERDIIWRLRRVTEFEWGSPTAWNEQMSSRITVNPTAKQAGVCAVKWWNEFGWMRGCVWRFGAVSSSETERMRWMNRVGQNMSLSLASCGCK